LCIDGVTRSTAPTLEVSNRERVITVAELGVQARSALTQLKDAYPAQGKLYDAIQPNPGYQRIKAACNLHHLYIFEDAALSLCPWCRWTPRSAWTGGLSTP